MVVKSKRGFTLIETLVSALLLAMGVVILGGLAHRCLTHESEGLHYEKAGALLNQHLERACASSLKDLAVRGVIEGPCQVDPAFHYRLAIKPDGGSDLYRIDARISWNEGNVPRLLTFSTVLYDWKTDSYAAPVWE